jgi:Protein of unknown function (DUF1631)
MMRDKRGVQKLETAQIPRELTAAGHSILSKCLVELLVKGREPKFRNDPKARDLYTRYDALDALDKFHESIVRTCLETAETSFLSSGPNTAAQATLDYDPWKLEVIEPDDIELANLLIPLADQLERRFSDPLLHLELRIEYFNKQSDKKLNPQAWHPQAFLQAFQQSVNRLALKLPGKYMLCEFFQQQLANHLSDFYVRSNKLLRDSGYLDNDRALENAIQVKRLEQEPSQDVAPPAQRPDSFAKFTRPPRPRMNVEAIDFLDTDPDAISSPSPAREATTSTAYGSIDDHFIDLLLAPNSPGTGSALSPYQRAQIIGALSTVQRNHAMSKIAPDIEEIKTAVKRVLYDSGIFNANELLEKEATALNFVNQIFQAVSADNSLSYAVKLLISKLQIPTIKLALLDFEFFKNPAHPARGVLNQLATLGVGIADGSDPLYIKLESVINRILKQYHTETPVFDQALSNLTALALSESERIRKIEEKSQLKAREEAKRTVAKTVIKKIIHRELKNKKLPVQIQKFIHECWIPYMEVVHVERGAKSKSWQEALKLLRRIINASQPPTSRATFQKLVGSLDSLFSTLHRKLTSITAQLDEPFKHLDALQRWFLEVNQHLQSEPSDSKYSDTERILTVDELDDTQQKTSVSTAAESEHRAEAVVTDQSSTGQKAIDKISIPTQTTNNSADNSQSERHLYDDNHGIDEFDEDITDTHEDRDELAKTQAYLEDAHTANEQDSLSAQVHPDHPQQAKPSGTPTDKAVEPMGARDNLAQLPPYVRPGTWFEVFQAEGKAKRRLKLSTILEDTGQILFANRAGEGELIIDIETFIEDLQEGLSKPINDSNLFDRALSSVISNIRKSQSEREFH